jgi:hypothetical protein
MHVRRKNLVPIPDPDPNPPPTFGTKEWTLEFEHFRAVFAKWQENQNDRIYFNELIRLGARLLPIDESPTD